MTQYLGPKTSGTNVATQSDVAGLPSGSLVPFAGSTAPSGYLVCDGAAVSRTTYAALFAAIGTTYGAGNGSTTFALPNLKGRVVAGVDSAQTEFDSLGETGGAKTHTLSSAEIPAHNHAVGTLAADTAGAHDHALSGGGHWHTYDRSTISVSTGSNFVRTGNSSGVTGVTLTNTSTATSTVTPTAKMDSSGSHSHVLSGSTANSTGGGGAHNNLPPYMALTYLIKT